MDKYTRSEISEARRARLLLEGEDVSAEPLWIVAGVPTVINAVTHLAPALDIVPIREEVTSSRSQITGQVRYHGIVTARLDGTTRVGAATSTDRDVVTLLAYRNAIRQLLEG